MVNDLHSESYGITISTHEQASNLISRSRLLREQLAEEALTAKLNLARSYSILGKSDLRDRHLDNFESSLRSYIERGVLPAESIFRLTELRDGVNSRQQVA